MTEPMDEAGIISEAPIVTESGPRTHCEACGEPLDPSALHRCAANQRYHDVGEPQPPVNMDEWPQV